MRIDIATLFPEMCESVLGESIIGRARKNGCVGIYTHDIRDYTLDKHRRVDDKPYGGGTGMVIAAQPVYDCVKAIEALHETKPRLIYLSPQGETLTQEKVKELSRESGLILLCGHYEGIDSRVLEELCAEEISVGDYVLTGGELPALILADAVARMLPGVLPNEDAYSDESHYSGLLEHPQYTRPEEWHGRAVPQTLISGNHREVDDWRRAAAIKVTLKKRPDMYRNYIASCISGIWQSYLASTGLDLGRDKPMGTLMLDAERFRRLKRGRIRSLPDDGYRTGEHVVVFDELLRARMILLITKTEGGAANFIIVYKTPMSVDSV